MQPHFGHETGIWFKVPIKAKKRKGAFHEPQEFRSLAHIKSGGGPPHSKTLARRPKSRALPPGFGARRPCGALDFPDRFMVPMNAKHRKEAFHAPSESNRTLRNSTFQLSGFGLASCR